MNIVLLRPSVTEARRIGERSLKTPLHWAIKGEQEPRTKRWEKAGARTGSEPIMPA